MVSQMSATSVHLEPFPLQVSLGLDDLRLQLLGGLLTVVEGGHAVGDHGDAVGAEEGHPAEGSPEDGLAVPAGELGGHRLRVQGVPRGEERPQRRQPLHQLGHDVATIISLSEKMIWVRKNLM